MAELGDEVFTAVSCEGLLSDPAYSTGGMSFSLENFYSRLAPLIMLVPRGQRIRLLAHQRGCRYTAPALDKGLDILELFASEPEGMAPSEVARRLGRTVGEIFRMLVCLQARGYISRS